MSTPSGPDPQREVARMRLPLPVRRLDRLTDYLEAAYGPGLTMMQDGEWVSFQRPELDGG